MATIPDLTAASTFNIKDWVALVTGGGTGIGLMIARGLASNGAKVYIASRRSDVVVKAAAENDFSAFGGKLIPLELDVTDKDSIRKAVATLEKAEGKLDILVNNAGQVGPRTTFFSDPQAPENASAETIGSALFDAQSFQDWADHYTVNVSSIFFVSTAFLGLLERAAKAKPNHSPSIINIGSISGLMKLAQNHFAYNSGKAAVHHLTKILATELALKGHPIRVNAIAPGVYPSEMAGSGTKHIDEECDEVSQGLLPLPAKRAGRDHEISAAVLYLAGPGGYYVNGQVLVVDGSYLAVNPSTV